MIMIIISCVTLDNFQNVSHCSIYSSQQPHDSEEENKDSSLHLIDKLSKPKLDGYLWIN